MKLNYVIIYVEDAVKATDFYAEAFDLKTRFIHESGMYAEMETGETVLSFANHQMLAMNIGIESSKENKSGFELAFSTDSVQEAFDKALSAGAREIKPPEKKPWGQTVGYVQDPYGTIIEICTPMG